MRRNELSLKRVAENPSGKMLRYPGARHRTAGMALVVMLAILVMVTVLVVALLTLATGERSSASLSLQRTQADALATLAADMAMANISSAISAGSQTNKSWASEPGRITVFDIAPGTGVITREGYDLFSALPTAANNVDLNAPSLSGQFPIAPPASGNTAATMKIGWQNILRNPSLAASQTNPIIGRIAYWVDDESCKVNINTADGSRKGNDGHYGGFPTANPTDGYSFGFGTPSEISLAALPGLDQTKARAIADSAWTQEFNSAEEIVRTPNAGITRADFENLRFDITHYNSSPDLNFMGEPRISLLRTLPATLTVARKNAFLGSTNRPEAQGGPAIDGLPLDALSPQPGQLPRPSFLPPAAGAPTNRWFLHTSGTNATVQFLAPGSEDHLVGSLIANFLNGRNLKGATFTWPAFDGADSAGFAGKYSPRQLDSIVLQILDTVKPVLSDQNGRVYSLMGMVEDGWLSSEPVLGVGRHARLTEVLLEAEARQADSLGYGAKIGDPSYSHPVLRLKIFTEYYFPTGFPGMPNMRPFELLTSQWRHYGFVEQGTPPPYRNFSGLNYLDQPSWNTNVNPFRPGTTPSPMGSLWMDQLLEARDQNGAPAGISFLASSSLYDDPDQAKAKLYHPYCRIYSGAAPVVPERYSGPIYETTGSGSVASPLRMRSPFDAAAELAPGVYTTSSNEYFATDHPARPDATSIRLVGGLHVWAASGGSRISIAPYEAIHPVLTNPTNPILPPDIKDRVLPVDFSVPVPSSPVSYLLRVADPLVNQFPGDWEAVTNPAPTDITMLTSTANATVYKRGGVASLDTFFNPTPPTATVPAITRRPVDADGDNPGFRPSGGGDPLSVWLPRLDPRIPKSARLPSVGALFAIRTGLFPDLDVASLPIRQQRGVPFRGLNMSPSNQASQTTEGGNSYPDWALLDLFTVPFLPQKPFGPATPVADPQPFRRLTDGGATQGRININNPPVPYPFGQDASINSAPPRRRALQALFFNLKPSNSYEPDGDPVYTTIDAATATSLAEAVASYQATNGPFFMAGEIANVPEVANYLYTFADQTSGPSRVASISRNDLVRDTIGALTTRSNVFSVWVTAQTIKKAAGNSNYGVFENGDRVTSEVRRRYLVERFIETGVDGVPGNAVAPAVANTPNAYPSTKPNGDDVTATPPIYHPSLTYPLPYRWRVVAVENIQM